MTLINNNFQENGFSYQPTTTTNQNQLNQNAFLEIMTTQLMNQNPTKPMDNGDFLGQMAQFSTVSGIENLNESMQALLGNSFENQRIEAANMIGNDVLVAANTFNHVEQAEVDGIISLFDPADKLELKIYDQNNVVIRTIAITPPSVGFNDFTWDGLDDNGNPMSANDTIRFVAEVTRGDDVTAATVFVYDQVESVSFNGNNEILLDLQHQGTINFDSVNQVR